MNQNPPLRGAGAAARVSTPPLAQDARACTDYYVTVLRWPVFPGPGHEHRPSGSEAYPRTGTLTSVPAGRPRAGYEAAPGAVLVPCTAFDALVLPHELGMTFMVELWSTSPPCAVSDNGEVTVLLQAATGEALLPQDPRLRLRCGAEQVIALPPTPGHRWDTPPWHPATGKPIAIPHGEQLAEPLRRTVRIHPPTAVPRPEKHTTD